MANYEKIIRDNLDLLYNNLPPNLERLLPGQRDQDFFRLKAFGRICRIQPDGITIGDEPETGVVGILITLYALHANEAPCWPTPFRAFRELPNSLPYVGAFATHTESILIPHVKAIEENLETIFQVLSGEDDQDLAGGDLSIIVRPLPKRNLSPSNPSKVPSANSPDRSKTLTELPGSSSSAFSQRPGTVSAHTEIIIRNKTGP